MPIKEYRQPLDRGAGGGVTIREIEERVRELNPAWTQSVVEAASLLFAILKEGCSTQKLLAFTRYPSEFLMNHVDHMRSRGELLTGTLSTQYILKEVPGSEDLIEKITGQRIVRETTTHKAPAGYQWEKHLKASPIALPAPPVAHSGRKEESMNTSINGAEAVGAGAETCGKSSDCGKPANHLGRCKGQGGSADRAVRRKANSQADPPKPRRNASKPTPATNGRKAQAVSKTTALTAIAGDGHYKIEYEDETRQFSFEGIGREPFKAALKSAEAALAGGSNG